LPLFQFLFERNAGSPVQEENLAQNEMEKLTVSPNCRSAGVPNVT
jgi:hypothetical protein